MTAKANADKESISPYVAILERNGRLTSRAIKVLEAPRIPVRSDAGFLTLQPHRKGPAQRRLGLRIAEPTFRGLRA